MEMLPNGDAHLSSFDRKMWALSYSCLYRFSCPVMFKIFGPNVPNKQSRYISFFVPSYHDKTYEVAEYLEQELNSERFAEGEMKGEFLYGTFVTIYEFSGIEYYQEQKIAKDMAKKLLASFMTKIKNIKNSN